MGNLTGHEAAIRELDRSVSTGRLAHAYLIAGPPHVGKMTLATRIAQAVNCLSTEDAPCGTCIQCRRISLGQHADIIVVGLESHQEERARKEIGIDDVRSMQHAATLNPYEGRYRVFIVNGAERLSEEACNALMKLLEEPPPHSLLLLLTPHPDSLLPTIHSRCRLLQLRPLSLKAVTDLLVEQKTLPFQEAQRLARLSLGCPGWALAALEDPSILEARTEEVKRIDRLARGNLEERFDYAAELANGFFRDRDGARDRLHLWLRWWRDLLLAKEGAGEYAMDEEGLENQQELAAGLTTEQVATFIQAIGQAMDALEANANPRLALEVLMLRLPAPAIGQRV